MPSKAALARNPRLVTLSTLAAIIVVLVGFVVEQLACVHNDDIGNIDLLVYRAGGHAVIAGHSLYASDFASVNASPNGLNFTYPPFAALIFAPLALLPAALAKALMIILNATACAVLFALLGLAVQKRWHRLSSWRSLTAPISTRTAVVVFVAWLVFLFSVPVLGNFAYGQVNLILAAAAALDILMPSVRWPRGLLVGLAAAVKITPAVFFGYFLITRQWRALAVSVAASLAATAVSWLVMPADTVKYFRTTIFDPARIGGLAFASNQSLRGVMERMPALDAIRGVLWVAAAVLVLVLAVVATEASRRAGDTVAAMLSIAIAGLLCSPVSWSHHWVWLSAAAVYLLVHWAGIGDTRSLVGGIAVATVTIAAPWIFLSNSHDRERLWNPFEHMLGSVWAATAVALLIWFAAAGGQRRGTESSHLSRGAWRPLASR